jgi:hypothetical protein
VNWTRSLVCLLLDKYHGQGIDGFQPSGRVATRLASLEPELLYHPKAERVIGVQIWQTQTLRRIS